MALKTKDKYKKGDKVKYHIDYGASPMLVKSKAEKSKEKEGRISKVKKGFLGKGWDYMINNITIPHGNIVGLAENVVRENIVVTDIGVSKEPQGYLVRLNKKNLFISKDKTRNLSRVDSGGGRGYVLNKKGNNSVIKMGDTYTITVHNTGRFDLDKKQMNKLKSLIGENTMKITKTQLVELIKEVLQEETEHQKFFKATLEKFGAKSIADLGDRKSEFFKAIDAHKVTDDEKGDVEETLEPMSQAAGEPEANPTMRLKAKKRDQILAQEKVENYVRKLVREELKFVMFNEVPGGTSRKVAKKRILQTGSTTKSL